MNRAVFLDRDGVINPTIFRSDTNEWGPPWRAEEFSIQADVLEALKALQRRGFLLFLVSNQPDFAKGKVPLENLWAVHAKFLEILKQGKIEFSGFYYCYHHPQGIVPAWTGPCECRKPSPFFLKEAERDCRLNMEHSWMVGDRKADIACGKAGGVRAILIESGKSQRVSANEHMPDFKAADLPQAVRIIIENMRLKRGVDRETSFKSKN